MSTTTSTLPVKKISTGRIALLLTLGTESVFFVTLLVAYAALREQVVWDVPHTLPRTAIPLVNTSILLASALVAWRAHVAIRRGRQSGLRGGLLIALLLGLLFVIGQIYEFSHAGLHIDDPSLGGVFFTLMGSHAVHVLAGVVFLALNLMRTCLGDFTAERHEAIELGTWFWYYVTAVWVVLFVELYVV